LTVKASSFDFSYGINDIYDCIKDTEISLRHLISKVMNQRYGNEWAWDIFEIIFCDRNKFCVYMGELNLFRKSIAHFRDVPLNKKYLYLGICGEMLLLIHSWMIGHSYKVKGYTADFRFQIRTTLKDDKDEQDKARKLAEKWIESVEKDSTKIEGFDSNSIFPDRLAKLVHFADGQLMVTEPSAGPNYYGYVSSASIFTENTNILDRVITSGNHPYWCLNWILEQNLDRPGDDKQITIVNYHGTIRIILRQFGRSKSQVGLVCDGENSFLSAHRYFNPSLILSMYDGRMDFSEFQYLLGKSFS